MSLNLFQKPNIYRLWIILSVLILITTVIFILFRPSHEIATPTLSPQEIYRRQSPDWEKPGKYWVTHLLTPNVYEGINEVEGIVLHHTAYPGTARQIAEALCRTTSDASCHVVIDDDGTRYILAEPEVITWHAGKSKLGDRFRANLFTVGIEFHGNTLEFPLTDEQIESAVEYLKPIITKYNIPAEKIVTHRMIREAYMEAMPKDKKVFPKVDITPVEYERVIFALDTAHLIFSNPDPPIFEDASRVSTQNLIVN